MPEIAGQMSMFGMIPEENWYMPALMERIGGGKFGSQNSRIRIYTAVTRLDKDRLADYIQNEYGISGGTANGVSIGFCCRGAEIYNFKTKEFTRVPWHRIRDMIVDRVYSGEYLQPDDWKQIEQIKKKHNGMLPLERPDGMPAYGGDEDGQLVQGESGGGPDGLQL